MTVGQHFTKTIHRENLTSLRLSLSTETLRMLPRQPRASVHNSSTNIPTSCDKLPVFTFSSKSSCQSKRECIIQLMRSTNLQHCNTKGLRWYFNSLIQKTTNATDIYYETNLRTYIRNPCTGFIIHNVLSEVGITGSSVMLKSRTDDTIKQTGSLTTNLGVPVSHYELLPTVW